MNPLSNPFLGDNDEIPLIWLGMTSIEQSNLIVHLARGYFNDTHLRQLRRLPGVQYLDENQNEMAHGLILDNPVVLGPLAVEIALRQALGHAEAKPNSQDIPDFISFDVEQAKKLRMAITRLLAEIHRKEEVATASSNPDPKAQGYIDGLQYAIATLRQLLDD